MRRLLAIIFLWVAAGRGEAAERPGPFFLELDIAIERSGITAILFDFGDGVWGDGDGASALQIPPGTKPQTVRLALPARPIRALRFDPTSGDEEIFIAGMRLVDARGEVLLRIDPRGLRATNQIGSMVVEAGGVRIRPSGGDPMLRFDLTSLQKRLHDATGRATVGKGTVVALALTLAAMLSGAVWVAWRALGKPGALLGGAAIFCLVFGARLMALNAFSRPVPFWDEWEGDALYVQIPFAGGFLDWGALVMPQWEHRILLTRVIGLFGTLLNGEWDVRVAMTVSASFYAATIALLGTALLATRRTIGAVAALVLAGCAALPFDVNNLFWGGQTQMYALVLMAVCTIALASAREITPWIWRAAFAGGAVSLFTMGAGPVGPGCAVGICLVRAVYEREQRRKLLVLAGIFFAVALAGVLLHTSSRAHVPLYATTFAQFKRAFVGVLAWPLSPHVFWAALSWLPWIFNGVAILRRREATPLEWLAVGLGGWGMINAVALGYARQYEGPPFDTRFYTPISMGMLASVCSSVALLVRARDMKGRVLPAAALVALAVGMLTVGLKGVELARETGVVRADLDHRIRTYLTTGDPALLVEKPPHHTGMVVVERLESPLLQRILPAVYRKALAARTPDAGASAAAVAKSIEAGPLTIAVRTLMKLGPAIALLGLFGYGFVLWRGRLGAEWIEGMRATAQRVREVAIDRLCYAGAVVLTIGWVWLYNTVMPSGLVDEPGHLANIHHFLEGKPGWPEAMPMLPGYHYMTISLWEIYPAMATLTAARWTTALVTLVGLAAFALARIRLHGRPAGRETLLLALLPLTQPFTGMAYTDMPALAFALCAWWAQVTERRALAALFLIGAVALRQTSLAWAGFFIVWEFFRTDEPRRTFLWRVRWLVLLLASAVVLVLLAGRLTVGSQHGNDFKFNSASVHFTAALVLVLGLPVLLAHAPAVWRQGVGLWRARRAVVMGLLAAGVGATAILTVTFANPHIWNRELFWEGCTFTLLRNWPLVWIDTHGWLRVVSAINIVLMTAAVGLAITRQAQRVALWWVLAVGALPVVTNGLVEPRYLIPAAGFLLCFVEIERSDWRRLAVWWAVLSAAHAPFVAKALSLW
ncbi:MAG: hypothetical protein V4773_30210 [Verrucomicrobiota bacterium]